MLSFKYYHVERLVPTILVLAGLLDYAMVSWIMPLAKAWDIGFLRAPTNVAIITGILKLHSDMLWKYRLGKWLIKVPDMTGRYRGLIEFIWDGERRKKNCVLEINQTASKIKVSAFFGNESKEGSESQSLVEDIKLGEDGYYRIYFFFRNTGGRIDSELDQHEGANELKYLPAANDGIAKLKGHYFTNRNTQTRGQLEVELESKKLKGEF